jgi:hypothetical protein
MMILVACIFVACLVVMQLQFIIILQQQLVLYGVSFEEAAPFSLNKLPCVWHCQSCFFKLPEYQEGLPVWVLLLILALYYPHHVICGFWTYEEAFLPCQQSLE